MKKEYDTEQNRKKFAKSLRYLIESSPYNVQNIAALLNVKPSTFYSWTNGGNLPKMANIQMLCDFFHVTVSDMLSGKVIDSHSVQKEESPIRGDPSGVFALSESSLKASSCLEMPDGSMDGAGIKKGDILFINEKTPVKNGETAYVSVFEKEFVRKVYSFPAHNILLFIPENPEFEEILLSGEEIKKARIIGKVIAVQKIV